MEFNTELNWTTVFYLYGLFYIWQRIQILIKKNKRDKRQVEQEVLSINTENVLSLIRLRMVLSLFDLMWIIAGSVYSEQRWLFVGIILLTYLPFIFSMRNGSNHEYLKKGFVHVTVSIILIATVIVFTHFVKPF